MSYSERRQYVRLELGLPVKLHIPGQKKPVTAEIKDISQGGCFFTASAPASDSELRVAVAFRRQPRVLFGSGSIVRRAGGQGFGVQFDGTSEDGARFLSALAVVTPELRSEFAEQFLDNEVQLTGPLSSV